MATAAEYGIECEHITADGDEAVQLSQIEQAIASGEYAGIIVEAAGEGVTNGFKEAQEAGIPIMTLHEGVQDNTNVDAIVQCSLAETGYQQIKLEVDELGDSFNLAIVNGSEGHGATVAIYEGYQRALEEFPDLNVVFEGTGNWAAEDAMALTETWFASGKQIDGIVCMNDGMATGVRQVMKDNGVLGTIPIYSNDCEEDTLVAIENGEQSGSFDMNAEAQCKAAIETMLKLIDGEELEEKDDIGRSASCYIGKSGGIPRQPQRKLLTSKQRHMAGPCMRGPRCYRAAACGMDLSMPCRIPWKYHKENRSWASAY